MNIDPSNYLPDQLEDYVALMPTLYPGQRGLAKLKHCSPNIPRIFRDPDSWAPCTLSRRLESRHQLEPVRYVVTIDVGSSTMQAIAHTFLPVDDWLEYRPAQPISSNPNERYMAWSDPSQVKADGPFLLVRIEPEKKFPYLLRRPGESAHHQHAFLRPARESEWGLEVLPGVELGQLIRVPDEQGRMRSRPRTLTRRFSTGEFSVSDGYFNEAGRFTCYDRGDPVNMEDILHTGEPCAIRDTPSQSWQRGFEYIGVYNGSYHVVCSRKEADRGYYYITPYAILDY